MNLAADAYSYSRVLRRPRTQDHESSHEYTGRRDVRLCVSMLCNGQDMSAATPSCDTIAVLQQQCRHWHPGQRKGRQQYQESGNSGDGDGGHGCGRHSCSGGGGGGGGDGGSCRWQQWRRAKGSCRASLLVHVDGVTRSAAAELGVVLVLDSRDRGVVDCLVLADGSQDRQEVWVQEPRAGPKRRRASRRGQLQNSSSPWMS